MTTFSHSVLVSRVFTIPFPFQKFFPIPFHEFFLDGKLRKAALPDEFNLDYVSLSECHEGSVFMTKNVSEKTRVNIALLSNLHPLKFAKKS